jgi:hypothetical protein
MGDAAIPATGAMPRAKGRGKRRISFAPFTKDRWNFASPNVDNGKSLHISWAPFDAASLADAADRREILRQIQKEQ